MSFFTISVPRSLVNRLALLFQAFGALCDREPPARFTMPHVTSFTIAFANSFHVTIIAILSATSIDFSDDHPSVRHHVREIVHVCISELCMRLLYEFSCACRTLYIEVKRTTCITISTPSSWSPMFNVLSSHANILDVVKDAFLPDPHVTPPYTVPHRLLALWSLAMVAVIP